MRDTGHTAAQGSPRGRWGRLPSFRRVPCTQENSLHGDTRAIYVSVCVCTRVHVCASSLGAGSVYPGTSPNSRPWKQSRAGTRLLLCPPPAPRSLPGATSLPGRVRAAGEARAEPLPSQGTAGRGASSPHHRPPLAAWPPSPDRLPPSPQSGSCPGSANS